MGPSFLEGISAGVLLGGILELWINPVHAVPVAFYYTLITATQRQEAIENKNNYRMKFKYLKKLLWTSIIY